MTAVLRCSLAFVVVVVLVVVVLGACKPMPPPPVVPFHAVTESAPKGTVTATLVFGIATQLLGGGGFGLALRVERQETEHTAVGVELTGGKGSDDEDERYWLFALRGFGRTELPDTRYVAMTYGAGLSLMNVGLVTLTLHGGSAVSYPNDYLAPSLQVGVAGAIPLRTGRSWGKQGSADIHCPGCFGAPLPMHEAVPADPVRAELFLFADAGLASTFGGTQNALSIAFGAAMPMRRDDGGLFALSIANGYRVDEPAPAPTTTD